MLDSAGDDTVGKVVGIVTQLAARHAIGRRFTVTDPLVDGGFTSMAMVDLMLAIEAGFDMTIPQAEMRPENFRSIATLAQMLQRLPAAAD